MSAEADLRLGDAIQRADTTALGARIRAVRLAQGLKQVELGGEVCSAAYVSRLEAGQRRPSVEVLRVFAQRLNVTPLFLLVGAGTGMQTWVVRQRTETVHVWHIDAPSAEEAQRMRATLLPDLASTTMLDLTITEETT